MGCDYYIIKALVIEFENKETGEKKEDYFELKRDYGYFEQPEDYDSDDSSISPSYYLSYLIVTYKPRILFTENKWKNREIQEKYKNIIFKYTSDKNRLLKITKKEIREFR